MRVPGEFESTTENAALKEAIVARIESEGGIAFREFMAMALYHPGLGYYCSPREKMGRTGDYVTSPEAGSVFGAMAGRQLREMWEAMDRPAAFETVEAGAGTGALCRDVLRWARRTAPGFHSALSYTIVEASAALAGRQSEVIESEGLTDKVRWAENLPAGVEGCILSNELLDAMPVHRVAVEGGRLREVFVGWDGTRLVEESREPSTPEIEAYFERLGLRPGEGCRAEVNLEAVRWMRGAAKALRHGFLLMFDYGYEADELFAPWRTDGTLLCFYRHNPSNDPYARIGRQDMTAHVDFTSVRRAGEEAGLATLGIVSQSEFLVNLGIGEAMAAPGEGEPAGIEDYYARRRQVLELIDTAGLGRIRVLVQAKGVGDVRLRGLGEGTGNEEPGT